MTEIAKSADRVKELEAEVKELRETVKNQNIEMRLLERLLEKKQTRRQ